jgi:hypothetical protein
VLQRTRCRPGAQAEATLRGYRRAKRGDWDPSRKPLDRGRPVAPCRCARQAGESIRRTHPGRLACQPRVGAVQGAARRCAGLRAPYPFVVGPNDCPHAWVPRRCHVAQPRPLAWRAHWPRRSPGGGRTSGRTDALLPLVGPCSGLRPLGPPSGLPPRNWLSERRVWKPPEHGWTLGHFEPAGGIEPTMQSSSGRRAVGSDRSPGPGDLVACPGASPPAPIPHGMILGPVMVGLDRTSSLGPDRSTPQPLPGKGWRPVTTRRIPAWLPMAVAYARIAWDQAATPA